MTAIDQESRWQLRNPG